MKTAGTFKAPDVLVDAVTEFFLQVWDVTYGGKKIPGIEPAGERPFKNLRVDTLLKGWPLLKGAELPFKWAFLALKADDYGAPDQEAFFNPRAKSLTLILNRKTPRHQVRERVEHELMHFVQVVSRDLGFQAGFAPGKARTPEFGEQGSNLRCPPHLPDCDLGVAYWMDDHEFYPTIHTLLQLLKVRVAMQDSEEGLAQVIKDLFNPRTTPYRVIELWHKHAPAKWRKAMAEVTKVLQKTKLREPSKKPSTPSRTAPPPRPTQEPEVQAPPPRKAPVVAPKAPVVAPRAPKAPAAPRAPRAPAFNAFTAEELADMPRVKLERYLQEAWKSMKRPDTLKIDEVLGILQSGRKPTLAELQTVAALLKKHKVVKDLAIRYLDHWEAQEVLDYLSALAMRTSLVQYPQELLAYIAKLPASEKVSVGALTEKLEKGKQPTIEDLKVLALALVRGRVSV